MPSPSRKITFFGFVLRAASTDFSVGVWDELAPATAPVATTIAARASAAVSTAARLLRFITPLFSCWTRLLSQLDETASPTYGGLSSSDVDKSCWGGEDSVAGGEGFVATARTSVLRSCRLRPMSISPIAPSRNGTPAWKVR